MLQAAVVEDESRVRAFLIRELEKAFAAVREEVAFTPFADGERFLRIAREQYHYDMVFLDIEMPGIDGLSLAKELRHIYPHLVLVFISSQEHLVFRSFTAEPFRFVRKQDFLREAPQLAADLSEKLRTQSRRLLTVTEPGTGDIYSFSLYELLYVEARGKDCRLVTQTGETLLRCSMGYLKEALEPWGFFQCHRGFLVNARAVYQFGKGSILLTGGVDIPLGRSFAKSARDAFLKEIGKEMV